MRIAISKESLAHEARVALTPTTVSKLTQAGFHISLEPQAGLSAGFSDQAYQNAGATIDANALANANIVLQIRALAADKLAQLKPDSVMISLLDPFNNPDLLDDLRNRQITALSLEMLPRTTYAQKMDVLSSQASLAGYAAVIHASHHLKQILPMMMTPAGTLAPAKVFVIGAGVAGLQAIATAKRLGARVEAYDVRAEVAEQVESLGAKFLQIQLDGQDSGPQVYANTLTAEQIAQQQAGMAAACAQADVVITTAQVFGRPAPRLIDQAMLDGMQAGSVVVDMAIENGGNVAGSQADQLVTTDNGVLLLAPINLASQVATHASDMFANNLVNLLLEFTSDNTLTWDWQHELLAACLITQQGTLVNQRVKEAAA